MKIRHAAVLALIGWYLLVPPVTGPDRWDGYGGTAHLELPLRVWTNLGSFDTAASCMAARKMEQDESALTKSVAKPGMMITAINKSTSWAQCIASDDPRLAGKSQ